MLAVSGTGAKHSYRLPMADFPLTTFVPRAPGGPARVALALAGAMACLVGLVPSIPATAAPLGPAGYRLVANEPLGPGVEHQTLRRDDPAQDVHVARLAPGMAGRLVPVLASGRLGGPSGIPEPTSAMCARVRCVAAVNGGFTDGDGRPVGAMISAGELLTTPGIEHIVLRVDGRGQATLRPGIDWSVGITTPDGRTLPVQAVNRPLTGEGVALYSRRWGLATATDATTTELALQLPAGAGILPTGRSAVRAGPASAGGNSLILPGQVVLSGRGAGARAVAELAQRAAAGAFLDVDVAGMLSAIGGSPQVLQNGAPTPPADYPDAFTQGRHPRTMVGITPTGEILLVTVDGRGASAGLTLREAAGLMSDLGAVDAMNLDGGGSTTFVAGGAVRNRPSHGGERPVGSALTVLPAPPAGGIGGPDGVPTTDPVAALLAQLDEALNGLLQPST